MRGTFGRILIAVEHGVLVAVSVCIVVVVFYNVLVRYLPITGKQMAWTEEIALFLLAWLAFWGAAAVHREGSHFAVDLLVTRLTTRLRLGVTTLTEVLCIAFLLFVIINAFNLIRGTAGDVSSILHLPLLIIHLALLISGCFMIIYSVRNIVYGFWGLRRRK